MNHICKVCRSGTSYESKICGTCFDMGLRDMTDEGVVIRIKDLVWFVGTARNDHDAAEHIRRALNDALLERLSEKRKQIESDLEEIWTRLKREV